jgi:hypothetical protein
MKLPDGQLLGPAIGHLSNEASVEDRTLQNDRLTMAYPSVFGQLLDRSFSDQVKLWPTEMELMMSSRFGERLKYGMSG